MYKWVRGLMVDEWMKKNDCYFQGEVSWCTTKPSVNLY